MSYMTIGELIAQAMADLDVSGKEAARRMGVTNQTRLNWMRGQRPTDPESIDAIAAFCGVSIVDVLIAAGYLSSEDVHDFAGGGGTTGTDSSWFLHSPDLEAAAA